MHEGKIHAEASILMSDVQSRFPCRDMCSAAWEQSEEKTPPRLVVEAVLRALANRGLFYSVGTIQVRTAVKVLLQYILQQGGGSANRENPRLTA